MAADKAVPAKAARTLGDIQGCMLVGRDVGLIRNRLGASSGGSEEITVTRTTGNKDLDRALDKSLVRLSQTFGIDPTFGFFDDEDPNAFAAPESNDISRTGTVLFGKQLFAELQAADPSGVSVLGVCSHEFAHVWQFQSGLYKTIRGDGPTVKRLELNADFLAGYYLGLRKSAVPAASLWIFGQKLWGLGDNNVNASDHHGTPEERTAAAEAGFKLSFVQKQDVTTAFRVGMEYVAAL
ncbi:MAG: metalloprotease [Micropepsaceae bacterium]